MAPASETIGERIRRLRLERGLSQRALAGPGVTAAYICRIEKGDRVPSVRALREIGRRLSVSAAYLETGEDLGDEERRELRLSDAELQLRLGSDVSAAEQELERLLEEAKGAGDTDAEIRASVGLGLAAGLRGDQQAAVERLAPLVNTARITAGSHPEAFAVLGRAYVEVGRGDAAVALFRDCLAAADEDDPDNAAMFVRFAGYLSASLVDRGEAAEAEAVLVDAAERARELTDPYVRIRLYWSQARIAAARDEGAVALSAMRRAIALLRTTEDTLQLGRAQLLYAEMLLEQERFEAAARHLDLADDLLERGAEVQDRAIAAAERAKLAARTGDGAHALQLANAAFALLDQTTDEHERGRAHWARAEALAATGELDDATSDFELGYRLLGGDSGRYSLAILRAWAGALRRAGQTDQALQLLDRAAALGERARRLTPR